MVPLTAPSTLENAPPLTHPGFRRSYTVPTKLIDSTNRASKGPLAATDDVETLFTHTAAKVVSFSAPFTGSRQGPSSGRRASGTEKELIGTLPWATSTERTIAAGTQQSTIAFVTCVLTETGPLRIYRVPSSGVSFLSSGSLLHPILLRSQCWCVDGQGKFVLRIRQDSYYRIELPPEGVDDQQKIEEFKGVLGKVLQYETTPCPFKAGYQDDLSSSLQTPVRTRHGNPPGRAKRWRLERIWVSEEAQRHTQGEVAEARTSSSSEDDDDRANGAVCNIMEEKSPLQQSPGTPTGVRGLKPFLRPLDFSSMRSVTAPSQLLTQKSTSIAATALLNIEPLTQYASSASSTDSFYSSNDCASASPPSQPNTNAPSPTASGYGLQTEGFIFKSRHTRDISDATITVDTQIANSLESPSIMPEDARSPSPPPTPTLVSDSDDTSDPPWSDALTPPDNFRLRRLPPDSSCRRALSPLPHPANLFTPPAETSKRQLSTALIQKTYALLLGPPAHLVALMIRIAVAIANGTSNVYPYDVGEKERKIPCTWESSGDEEDEWDEDDCGVPLGNVESNSSSCGVATPSHGR